MMPDMSGFDVCAALKADARTAHVPVIMVTALDQAEDRVKGLECGADDFLTKPVSDVALVTRVKSLVRLKMVTDELALRAAAMQSVGQSSVDLFAENADIGGRILVVDDRENSTGRIRQALKRRFEVEITADPADAPRSRRRRSDFDLLIVSLTLAAGDGLRLCSQIRSIDRLRQTPVLLITDADETPALMRALDLGVNDYIIRPIDIMELRARVRTQLRRKRYAERLRDMVSSAVELAVTDPLTGLYNRRYLDAHLAVGRRARRRDARSRSACCSSTSIISRASTTPTGTTPATTCCAISATGCAAACAASISSRATAARSSCSSCRRPMRASPRPSRSGLRREVEKDVFVHPHPGSASR